MKSEKEIRERYYKELDNIKKHMAGIPKPRNSQETMSERMRRAALEIAQNEAALLKWVLED